MNGKNRSLIDENRKLIDRVEDQVQYYAGRKGINNQEVIKDLIQDVFVALLKQFQNQDKQIKFLPTYIARAAENHVRNYLKKLSRQPTEQIDNIDKIKNLDNRNATEDQFDDKETVSKSILQRQKEEDPDRYKSIEKSIEYVALLYFLKRNLSAANEYILPYVRSMNALKEAKAKIDALARPLPIKVIKTLFKKLRKMHPMPSDFPDPSSELALLLNMKPLSATEMIRRCYETIRPYPKELNDFNRNYSFYVDGGWKISKSLEDQIGELQNVVAFELSGPGTSPLHFYSRHLGDIAQLEDWIIDSIPRLRADPSMLLLRVFYRIFKIRAGRYSARSKIGEFLLELAEKNRKTYLMDIFQKINRKTNFETLRKKLYQKGGRAIYDKLAEHIYSRCFLQTYL